MVDFGEPDELRRWLGEQPRHVGIALAARAALRVLPMIGTPSATAGTGPLLLADAIHAQTHFRLLSIAWAAFGQSFGDPWIVARARSAAAVSLPIGTLFTSPAASTARLSAANVVRALTTSGQDSIDSLVAAIREAYSAEAEFPTDARGASALAGDVEFLAGRDALLLNCVPLWPNRPPTWFDPRWRDLKAFLQRVHQDWKIWTTWYDDRLAGIVNSIEREVAYVDVPDDLWRKDPAAVNAEIIKRIEKREPPPRPVAPPSAVTNLGIALARNDPPPLDFSKREDLQRWLAGKSTDVTVVFVARGSLRSFPLLCDALGSRGGGVSRIGKNVILPVFRAIAAAWVAGRYHGAGPTLFDAVAAANFSLPASGSAPDDAGIAVRTAMAAASFAADSFAGASLDDPNSDAAHAAFVSAAEVIADARLIEQGWSAAALADHPLWSAEFPSRERDYWGHLERALLKENPDWKVWTDWYRARLEGRPADEVVEVARVMIAEGIWQQGPRAVNAEIARLIDSNRQSELDRPDTVTVLPRPEYTISIADDSTIVIGFSNYAGGLLSNFVKALKQSIDNAQFIAIFETVETAKSLVVHLDPLVVPAAELAEKIAELIEDQRIAVPASLRPPDALLPSPSPATRFTYANGRFDIASSDAWRDREARAGAYHSRARDLAAGLAERLSRTDAVPDVAGSVKALIDVLGESVAEVQPDLLRLASRSIAARARAYGHPAAQWEISADAVGAFFELADVLVDLQTFVRTDLEAHERAVRELDLTPEKAADAKIALDLVTDAILSAPEVISETAQTAFEAAAEVSQTAADQDVKVAVEGDRTLLTANLALAVARELGRDVKGADHETAVQTGDHPAGKLPPRELGPKPGEPEKRKTRTRRTKAADARAAERSWQGFADRVVARIYDKGPNRIADATVDALTGIIRHGPKTAFGLGAALVLWAASSPIVAGGALATTIGWISYELRRKSKHPK